MILSSGDWTHLDTVGGDLKRSSKKIQLNSAQRLSEFLLTAVICGSSNSQCHVVLRPRLHAPRLISWHRTPVVNFVERRSSATLRPSQPRKRRAYAGAWPPNEAASMDEAKIQRESDTGEIKPGSYVYSYIFLHCQWM